MRPRVLKCVVWDLDNTVWTGVLAEGEAVALRPEAEQLVRALDERGVLQSIASRNDEAALTMLEAMGLRAFFLCPELGSMAKSAAVARIAETLDVALDAVAFIDDEPVERAEVTHALPEVLCVDAREVANLLHRPDLLIPAGAGLNRRQLHLADLNRRKAETAAGGPSEAFLRTLDMSMVLRRAAPADLDRIEELLLRTHQLNSTGRYLPVDELGRLCAADDHLAVVADLRDCFGEQGTIGFALLTRAAVWTLRMLSVSCRVRDQGVGGAILDALMQGAERAQFRLQAEFIPTERNRRLYVMLKLAGFEVIAQTPPVVLLQAEIRSRSPASPWITVDDRTRELLR
jgi:FkbH-like protein